MSSKTKYTICGIAFGIIPLSIFAYNFLRKEKKNE